jgi:hypothetical protein
MTYHTIEDIHLSVDVAGDTPVVTARTRPEATIWGAPSAWPLQLRIRFTRHGAAWLASDAVAST